MLNRSIVFGGGCFWCIEAAFRRIPGVIKAESGYAGGETENPDYESVCTGESGHAEVVRVEWDPEQVSLQELLELFWKVHDPGSLNRQGADVGSQYRSAIYYTEPEQLKTIEASISALEASGKLSAPLVTEIAPLKQFYPAEPYHKDYYERHPYAGYCRVVIQPKLKKAGLPEETIFKKK
jgi:peptide-methionine (S)-S-oxide reductase